MTHETASRSLTRRRFVAGALFTSVTIGTQTSVLAQKQPVDTPGVGPIVFLKERLGLTLHASTPEPGSYEQEALRGLTSLGFSARPGRWAVVRGGDTKTPVGWLVSAQFGEATAENASPVERYEDYDLKESTAASFVSTAMDNDHAVVLRHRQWDALHMFAPIAPQNELADMLLPVQGKSPVFSYSSKQLFEQGVAEYFSKLGEVNVRGVRYFRRLRLKNLKGQVLYDKQNA